MMKWKTLAALAALALSALSPALAQDAGKPTAALLSDAYTGKAYSPYARRNFPERPLWGDSHLHTSLSMDAGLFGNRLPPTEAYRLARGEEVVSSTGQAVRLVASLWTGWLSPIIQMAWAWWVISPVVNQSLLAYEQARRWNKGMSEGGDAAVAAAIDLIETFSQAKMDPEMFALYSPGSKIYKNLWEKVIADAETFNDPGRFTAFIGFEWTSLVKGANMHRVVIMRDGPTRARQVVPYTTQAPVGSPNPRDLWKYLTNYEQRTQGEILAIAHNGNLSNGIMFPLEAQWEGTKLDDTYVTERIKWEPLYENHPDQG